MFIASYTRLDEDTGKRLFFLTTIKTNSLILAQDTALKMFDDDQRPAGYCWSLVGVKPL